jgi:hypothetical protein
MNFPNFLTFTLDTPLALQQRGSEEKESTMFFPNFLTFTLETPTLFRQQKNWRHRRKRRSPSTFSYQLCSRRKEQIFQTSKGVQRTYVTVANQSTVHRTNPTEEIQYQRTAAQTTVASPTNNSFRTNTFVRRQQSTKIFLKLFCLIGKHNWSESISFSPNQILQTPNGVYRITDQKISAFC